MDAAFRLRIFLNQYLFLFRYKLKILVGFAQIASNLAVGIELQWPDTFRRYISTLDASNTDYIRCKAYHLNDHDSRAPNLIHHMAFRDERRVRARMCFLQKTCHNDFVATPRSPRSCDNIFRREPFSPDAVVDILPKVKQHPTAHEVD